ncbi:MAG: putative aminohydrolase SsnA [Elusimicrobiota bacterium]|nr:putative aminohydrolase SsnA [Endomicrobiia bacterium]MDW8055524.1 putative aminohydrolase SsnA [Elusimicrobiota bacterium]
MMFTLVCNGILIDPIQDRVIHNCGILLDNNGTIIDVGTNDEMRSKAFKLTEETKTIHLKFLDLKGRVIIPGLVCAHHHFYSSFARGLLLKDYSAKNFYDILDQLWWKLDKLLSSEEIYYSAVAALIDCLRNGVTTVIDHHESQGVQKGSLQQIAKAVKTIGLRASLCLGVSDRFGKGDEGIQATEEFINETLLDSTNNYNILPMIGLHASFTVNDLTLNKISKLKEKYKLGIHTHCAEDELDEHNCIEKYNCRVVERFDKFGLLDDKTILAHCVHINEDEMKLIAERKSNIVLNPESNMNNAVGCANLLKMLQYGINVGLGTDAMSSHMILQARSLCLIQRHHFKNPNIAFVESANTLLKANVKIVEILFGKKFNTFSAGIPLDAVVYNYIPPTPITNNNYYGHLLYGIAYATVDTVYVNGKQLLSEGKVINFSEKDLLNEVRKIAERFWEKF